MYFTVCNHGDHIQTWQTENFSNSLGQNLKLQHVLVVDSKCHWMSQMIWLMIILIWDCQFIWRWMILITCSHGKRKHLKSVSVHNIQGEIGQFCGCWWLSSSHPQIINSHGSGSLPPGFGKTATPHCVWLWSPASETILNVLSTMAFGFFKSQKCHRRHRKRSTDLSDEKLCWNKFI